MYLIYNIETGEVLTYQRYQIITAERVRKHWGDVLGVWVSYAVSTFPLLVKDMGQTVAHILR